MKTEQRIQSAISRARRWKIAGVIFGILGAAAGILAIYHAALGDSVRAVASVGGMVACFGIGRNSFRSAEFWSYRSNWESTDETNAT